MSLPAAPVAIPGLLLRFLEAASVGFGCTRDRGLSPRIHWVSGWQAEPDGRSIRCYIPEAFRSGLAEAFADNGLFALTVERIGAHETYQFKGTASELRPIQPDERRVVGACRDRFVTAVRALGPYFNRPELDLPGYILEAAVAFRLSVSEIFVQTPGPGAGKRLVPPEDRP